MSSAVKWLQRWRESGSAAPRPRGGSVSPLERHKARVLAVIAGQPDLTLVETVTELRKPRIRTSRSSLWRFLDQHGITFKKSLQAAERQRADVARARRRWIREQGMLDPARLVFIDETAATTNMVRLRGRAPRGVRVDGSRLRSLVNGKSYGIGKPELVSLQTLRERVKSAGRPPGRLKASVVSGDVQQMHQLPENAGALFQVASQFNLLEMVSPEITLEHGVTRYEHDRTQGPACAIAAGAGAHCAPGRSPWSIRYRPLSTCSG